MVLHGVTVDEGTVWAITQVSFIWVDCLDPATPANAANAIDHALRSAEHAKNEEKCTMGIMSERVLKT